MNTNTNRRARLLSLQTPVAVDAVDATDETPEQEVVTSTEENEFGPILNSTFSIKVPNGKKDKDGNPEYFYKNDKEPFKYQGFFGVITYLQFLGAKLPDANVEALGKALTSDDKETDESIQKAIKQLIKDATAKEKADAKASAYQSLLNKHKPLDESQRETAIARTINNFVKLAGITPEVAIEVLKSKGAVPEEYTVMDYRTTPLRKSKADSSNNDEDDE